MTTDPLFYRLFETSPETFFLLLGIPGDEAAALATRYQYMAIEFKETSHRTDGVFLPKEPKLPLYFVEVQFYSRANIFADLLVKVFTYLKHHDPAQNFRGVVLFASRSLEPADITPYRALMDSGQVKAFYLDELPELANAPLGLSILYLIRREESEAPAVARELVARVKREIADAALMHDLIELIETVVIYKLAQFSREEIQAMLKVKDIRETRVYREAMEEGREEGKVEGKKEKAARTIVNMAAKKVPPEEIAAMVEEDIEFVDQVLKGRTNG